MIPKTVSIKDARSPKLLPVFPTVKKAWETAIPPFCPVTDRMSSVANSGIPLASTREVNADEAVAGAPVDVDKD